MFEGSKIFVGYHALGFVCNHVPLSLRLIAKRKEHLVVTCVGKAFHTYNSSKLELLAVSDTHPDDINCLTSDSYHDYTACNNIIRAHTHGQQVLHTYKGHEKTVHLLLPFGEHLISVDEGSNMKIWDIKTEEIYLDVEFDNQTFQITCMMHPSTYLNKILLGSRQGTLQIWNIKRNALVHTFAGWGSSITVLEQAPVVDVVAVGLEDGRILVHNIKFDETLVSFVHDWGPVTSIAFRTDGEPIMATGSTVGHIAIWNLEKRKLQAQMREAHRSSITGMRFLQSEPLLVTNSADNFIKMWIFDQADGSGRLLRKRSGHSAPPSRILFYGKDGRNIVSAGQDSSLKSFSTFHESLNRDFGQAYDNKKYGKRLKNKKAHHKMGAITAIAGESCKRSDWDSIVTCHQGSGTVITWDYTKATMGKHKICPSELEDDLGAQATAVDITGCGNFVLIGWNTGHVKLYNIQSGMLRGTYGKDKAHSGPVRGVSADGLNQVVFTAAADKKVKFWHFREKTLLHELILDNSVAHVRLHRESSMLAVAMDNFSIVLIDVELRRVVRKFLGHGNVILDMTFSVDARWLVTSSMDSSIRTWDLPTAKLVDCFLVDSAATSLALSPTNAFLATTHVDDLGVYLWSNKTLYSNVALRPLPIDFQPAMVLMPGTGVGTEEDAENEGSHTDVSLMMEEYSSPEQISAHLVTLSVLPNSRWQSLTNLELIKKRNKPKQPVKVPKTAPFFLPVASGLNPTLDIQDDSQIKEDGKTNVPVSFNLDSSNLCRLLANALKEGHYEAVMEYMKTLNPSATDMEMRSLTPVGGGSHVAMESFLKFLMNWMDTNRDYELVQAYICLFLKICGEEITEAPSLVALLQELVSKQQQSWTRIEGQFNRTMCLINYLKSAVL